MTHLRSESPDSRYSSTGTGGLRSQVGRPSLLGIAGPMHSGKTTAAYFLQKTYGGTVFAFADRMKEECQRLVRVLIGEHIDPWRDKNPRVRALLQHFAQALRIYDESIWIRATLSAIEEDLARGTDLCYIGDVRFPEEIAAIRAFGGRVIQLRPPLEAYYTRLARDYGLGREDPLFAHESEIHARTEMDADAWIVSVNQQEMEDRLATVMAMWGISPVPPMPAAHEG